jgi:hypothetical protein
MDSEERRRKMKINLRKVVVVVAVLGMLLTTACSSNVSPEGYTFMEKQSGITFHIERKDRNTAVLFVPFEAPKTPLPLDEVVLDPKWEIALERAYEIFNYANTEHRIEYDTMLEFESTEEYAETEDSDSIMYTFLNSLNVLWTEKESYVMLSISCPKAGFKPENQDWQIFLHVCYDIAKYAENHIPEDVV